MNFTITGVFVGATLPQQSQYGSYQDVWINHSTRPEKQEISTFKASQNQYENTIGLVANLQQGMMVSVEFVLKPNSPKSGAHMGKWFNGLKIKNIVPMQQQQPQQQPMQQQFQQQPMQQQFQQQPMQQQPQQQPMQQQPQQQPMQQQPQQQQNTGGYQTQNNDNGNYPPDQNKPIIPNDDFIEDDVPY